MPLLDHHRPPVKRRLPWPSLHSGMLTELTAGLNARLPSGFVALDSVRIGPAAEIDVATYDVRSLPDSVPDTGYLPPPAAAVMPFEYAAATELRVYLGEASDTLVGAVELVSPSNKDRPATRRAFVSKVADYLFAGVSVIVLDTVTDLHANLHDELIDLLAAPAALKLSAASALYAVAYRPTRRGPDSQVDIWTATFALGDPLPTMPLRLTGDLFVPVDFEAAYMEACRKRKLLP